MVRILALPIVAILFAGCVGTGFSTPDYVNGLARLSAGDPGSKSPARAKLDGDAVTFEDLLLALDLESPSLAAALARTKQAAGRRWQAELFPNPELELEANEVPGRHVGLHRSQNLAVLTQPVPTGGRIGAAALEAGSEHARSLHALEAERWGLRGALREAHARILHANEGIGLSDELIAVAERTRDVATTRFESRAGLEAEAIRTRVEIQEIRIGRRRLERDRMTWSARLQELLGGTRVEPARLVGVLPDTFAPLDRAALLAALETHPAVLAGVAAVEAGGHAVALAEAEQFPDIGIRLAAGMDTDADRTILEAGIRIPLPIFDRNQGRILEAKAKVEQAEFELLQIRLDLHSGLERAIEEYEASVDELRILTEEILPGAARALEQTAEVYRAGRADLLDVLDAQATHARARRSLLDARLEAALARARIESRVARDFGGHP